jgi:hypothetical protein
MKNLSVSSSVRIFTRAMLLFYASVALVSCNSSSGGNPGRDGGETGFIDDPQPSPSYSGFIHTVLSYSDGDTTTYTQAGRISMNSSDNLAYGNGLMFATDEGYDDTSSDHLKVIDIASFSEVGRLDNVFSVLGMHVNSDGYLYVLTVGFLYQLNITNPVSVYRSDRVILSSLDALIYKEKILSAGYSDGFFIYDLNEVEPYERRKLLGSINLDDNQIRSVSVLRDDIVIVAARDGGIYILNTTQPDSISVLSQYDPEAIVWDIASFGNVAYLAEGSRIEILDVSNPVAPAALAVIDVPGFAMDVTINDGHAAIALEDGGTILHDITKEPDKDNLVLIPVTEGPSETALYYDGELYIAESSAILKYQSNMTVN